LQRTICSDLGISKGTGHYWKKQCDNIESFAQRHTRRRSGKLGRCSKVTKSTCKILVSPSWNPVCRECYEAQTEYHYLPCQTCQLQRKLKEHTDRGQQYKCAFVKKIVSSKNKKEREIYSREHDSKPLIGFWDHIFFTDEAHVDPTSLVQQEVLREQGKHYNKETFSTGYKNKRSSFI
jgi:hypothetical protein